MRVFICEKPSQARDIAAVLGAGRRGDGVFLGERDAVTWCFGHLFELAPPDAYDPALKKWSLESLPIIPVGWKLELKKEAGKQFKAIKAVLVTAKEVVVATDADREGETIGREVLEAAGWRGPVKRLWLSALDAASVKKALGQLLPGEKTAPLYAAGQGRSRADWLVGMNMTRAFTVLGRSSGVDGVLSVGRVQTPTLRLVVDRDREIERFVPKDYWDVLAQLVKTTGGNSFKAKWVAPEGVCDSEGRCISEFAALHVAQAIALQVGQVSKAETRRVVEAPPLPFDLSTLQQECSRRFGMGAQQTLKSAQKLYEEHKATSYPRTDCQYLPLSQLAEADAVLVALVKADPALMQVLVGHCNRQLKSKAWDDTKITAHHAIIPTAAPVDVMAMAESERRVYDLIRRRYLAQFYPAHEFDQTRVEVLFGQHPLVATGRVQRVLGWKAVLADAVQEPTDDDGHMPLPAIQMGEAVLCQSATAEKKHTKPPSHYTEGTLIQAMKSVGKLVQDARLRHVLKETSGLGTEATRAAIIDTLVDREYVEHKGKKKHLVSSAKGRMLIDAVPEAVKDVETTAIWEQALDEIAQGRGNLAAFQAQQEAWIRAMVAKLQTGEGTRMQVVAGGAKGASGGFRSGSSSEDKAKNGAGAQGNASKLAEAHSCPTCAKPLRRIKGGKGFFWGCSGYPACKSTLNDKAGKPVTKAAGNSRGAA